MRTTATVLTAFLLLPVLAPPLSGQDFDPNDLSTFSIIARDPDTGELGEGVQSKAFAAGNRAYTAKGGVVIIAHQASANPMYGAMGIELLEQGYSPQEALDMMVASDEGRDRRQVSILDIQGRSAAWTGESTSDWHGHHCGRNYCAQGNILVGPQVVEALVRSFEGSEGSAKTLAERLMDALDAGQAAGGDARGKESGAILVVKPRVNGGFSDRVVDIRVDDSREPFKEMRRILDMHYSRQMVRTAQEQVDSGDLDAALETARAACDRSPDNDVAWVALAEVHLARGEKSAALDAVAEAIELNPGNKRQLPEDSDFRSLYDDPDFRRLVGGDR